MASEFNAGLTATYRIQFHKNFDFSAGAALAGYLRDLGVSHVYASPIMKARAGSMHGYDVTDFDVINPELGGEAGLRELSAALTKVGLGLIIDIVPNHMAVGGDDNPYWLDLLEKGADSAYADFFDVDLAAAGLNGKVLVPLLGMSYREALANGELELKLREDGERYAVYHHEHCFPIREVDQPSIRAEGVEAFKAPERLHALLEAQHYRLASWRTANDWLNYRRFFEITTLAGVRIERAEAFDKLHRAPLQLYAEGVIDGVRVDHIDGLTDPAGYCRRLREALRAQTPKRPADRRHEPYIVVENILAFDEDLPRWPIEGTTGYDFMNEVSALQHRASGERPLQFYWRETSLRPTDFDEEERVARSELLGRNFAGQLEACIDLIYRCCLELSQDRDLTRGAMRRAVIAVIGHLRVYRSYAHGGPDNPGAGEDLQRAFAAARAEPSRDDEALHWLEELMNMRSDSETLREAIRRFHQLTAPVAAKSVEDTAFYRYGVLLSRNDVGFNPAMMALDTPKFHARMTTRARDWPHAMLTTATHDHKRGEDARARLAVLSEIPDAWIERARAWSDLNAPLRAQGFDRADEYMLFQSIVGAWPPGLKPDDSEGLRAFADRIATWQNKALREAKLRTSWLTPQEDYERIAETYARAALDPEVSAPFLDGVASFVDKIAAAGMANSLTQTALRCLLPGVPDLYQGCELWDFSLVDPDNRRPVDYARRAELLKGGETDRESGALKQALVHRLLSLRREARDLFAHADYRPVEVEGVEGADVIAFERRHGGQSLRAAMVLRAGARLFGAQRLTPAAKVWGGAKLPFGLEGYARICGGEGASLAEVFAESPVAVWVKR